MWVNREYKSTAYTKLQGKKLVKLSLQEYSLETGVSEPCPEALEALAEKLTQGSNSFSLTWAVDTNFQLKVEAASQVVKKGYCFPTLWLGHAAALLRGNTLDPLLWINLKTSL